MLITIYQNPSCRSSKKPTEWLETNNIPYTKYCINSITQRQLTSILILTKNGIEDIKKKMETK